MARKPFDENITIQERNEMLVEMFGASILLKSEEYIKSLVSFYKAVDFLATHKLNLEFNH